MSRYLSITRWRQTLWVTAIAKQILGPATGGSNKLRSAKCDSPSVETSKCARWVKARMKWKQKAKDPEQICLDLIKWPLTAGYPSACTSECLPAKKMTHTHTRMYALVIFSFFPVCVSAAFLQPDAFLDIPSPEIIRFFPPRGYQSSAAIWCGTVGEGLNYTAPV